MWLNVRCANCNAELPVTHKDDTLTVGQCTNCIDSLVQQATEPILKKANHTLSQALLVENSIKDAKELLTTLYAAITDSTM